MDRLRPDVVLLDIRLGDGTGFEVLERTQWKEAQVIFITAYDQHVMRAFRVAAVDYLLKPVDVDLLGQALKRAQRAHAPQTAMETLFRNMSRPDEERIVVPCSEGIHVLAPRNILRCEADGNYTRIHTSDGERLVTARTLKDFDDLLTPHRFERVHMSHLVNLLHVRKFLNRDGGMLVLTDGTEVPVSQRKRQALWYRVYTGNNTSVMLYLQSFQSAHIGFGFYSACGVTNSCLSPAQGYTEIPVLTPNTYYYLQVYTLVNSNPSNSGLFCMHWFNPPPAPPANDDCANATLLNVGTTCTYTSGDGAWATPSNANLFCNPDIVAEPNDDVWYRFVAPAATTVITVDGDGTSTTGYDAVLAIGDMSSCSGSMDAIACSNTTGPGGVETIITDALVPGQTYYLQVFDADGASPQPGSFGICVYASVLLTVNESAPEDHNLLSLTNTVGLYLVNTPFAEAATCDLLVLDAMGRSVHQSRSPLIPGNARSLDLTELVPGPYVFVVQRAGETRAQRFVRH
ncbi:MAG: response regulator transcription factor [Flavobacteriales bacterium]|nr:response regulator transcription factor [Flavobacteriales bacterium]